MKHMYSLAGAVAVLNPQGLVALAERDLIIHATLLMLVVIVPVYVLIFLIAWYYRAGNTKAKYVPNWEHAKMDELVWWAIPFEIVLVLGALTWSSTHQLDPRKPLALEAKSLVVEVVALEWKWLFIYPEQGIATVNLVEFPAGRPVEFHITADAPMNSFWIPQLGGQIYAMTGMSTALSLAADHPGDFAGGSANYSGAGFAQMKFVARASSQKDFDAWVTQTKSSPRVLDWNTYTQLAKPATTTPLTYASVEKNLYNRVLMQFNAPVSLPH